MTARMWIDTASDHKRISLKEGVRSRDACLSRSRYKAPWYPAITPAHPQMWRAVQFTLKPPSADNARATTRRILVIQTVPVTALICSVKQTVERHRLGEKR